MSRCSLPCLGQGLHLPPPSVFGNLSVKETKSSTTKSKVKLYPLNRKLKTMEMLIEYCLQHFDKGGVAMLLVWMYFIHRDVKSNSDDINTIKNNHLYHIEKDIAVLKEKSKDL